MKRRLLSAFLAVMMVLTMAPVAFAADTTETNDDVVHVNSYEELVNAIDGATGDNCTISVDTKIEAAKPIEITKSVKLEGTSAITAANNFSGSALVELKTADTTLTLGDITLNADEKARVIYCNAGKLVVDGATICGGKTANSYIGGVYMTNASQFEMNSGTIMNNKVSDKYANDSYKQYSADLWIGANANGAMTAINGGFIGSVFVNSNAWSAQNPGGFVMNDGHVGNLYVEYDSGYGASFTYKGGTIESLYVSTTEGNGHKVKVTPVVGMAYVGGQTSEEATSPVAKIGDTGYATLAAAVAAAKDGSTIELLKDYTGNLWLTKGEDVTVNLNDHTLSNKNYPVYVKHGKLTVNGPGEIKENTPDFGAILIKGSANQSDTDYASVTVNKEVTLEGWAPVFIDQNSAKAYGVSVNLNGVTLNAKNDTSNAVGAGVYVNGQITDAVNAPVINLDSTTIASTGHGMYLAGYATTTVNGGSVSGSETGIEIRAGKLTVNGATVTGNGIPTSVTPNGNGSTSVGAGIAVAQHTTKLPIDVTISDGVISGYTGLLESNPQNNPAASIARVNINVTGGKFAAINGGKNAVSSDDKRVIISGGVFAQKFDNSYCATGMTVVSNESAETKTTYPWTVGTIKAENESNIETGSEVGTTKAEVTGVTGSENIAAAKKVAENVKPAKAPTESTPITDADKTSAVTALVNAGHLTLTEDKKIPSDTQVTVVKKIYFDVKLTNLNMNNGTTNLSFTVDITPKYDLVAVSEKNNTKNEVVLKSNQNANVDKATISVILPSNFVTDTNTKVYVLHTKNGTNYMYNATITQNGADYIATFDDPHGFSEFKLVTTLPVATITKNGVTTSYDSLKEAAAAANDGDEIIVNSGASHEITFNTTKSVKVTNKTDNKITVKFNGTNKDVAKDATETFSYTKPSSGGSSGGSSSGQTTYKVTTSAVNNGGVNASPSSAEKGASITITLSPDKGYKLDKLTVTDGSGKTVSTVKKSDTVYTFTMPASAVNVGVSYVKADATPSETKFNDVSANDWFASAVDYVTGKGMMNGTADNTFSPKANTTRGMVVTVLYRLENQPSTSAASFTDVASGAYYANAVAWANANGIVSGYGSGKFGPNDKVTREQLAAILYRYAQYKKYDVSGANSLDGYTDAQSVSSYAVPALQWANAAGVVTGKSGSKLDPKGNAARAEVAAMLMRFCENVK